MNDLANLRARLQIKSNGSDFDTEAALVKYRVDPSKRIEKPRIVLTCQGSPLATIGNCSLIIGKAKTKKTFLITSMVAAAVCGQSSVSCISGDMEGLEVVLIDTEQAPYHLQQTVDRIIRQTGEDNPENFTAYGLRPLTAAQRLQVIEMIVNGLTGPALIVIDGLRDLLSRGINDESEATEIISKVLKWTYKKECHIMLVLHQNKGDLNARGHIGTEAVNKSETVLSVQRDTKNQQISIVTAEYCRDIDFPAFAFTVGADGLPYEVDQVEATESRKSAEMADNFKHILPGLRSMSYTELCKEYAEISGAADRTVKRHIAQACKSGLIKKSANGIYRLAAESNSEENDPF